MPVWVQDFPVLGPGCQGEVISTTRLHLHADSLLSSWGRWTDILSHGRYKRQLAEQDVETICRAILVYCLNHYRGDENIKSFIWDLITPTADGQTRALLNHSGRLVLCSGSQKAARNTAIGKAWRCRLCFPLCPDTVLSSAKAPMTVTLVLVGLSAPVPRGRKGKKVKTQSTQPVVQDADWLASCNPDALFQEDSYKKHLKHHCNK